MSINKTVSATGNIFEAWDRMRSTIKKLMEDHEVISKTAFEEYLSSVYDHYSKMKTIISDVNYVDLEKNYECVDLKQGRNGKVNSSKARNIMDLGKKILIRGIGGIGKTTLMRYLLLDTIRTMDAIPIFIELRRINVLKTDKFSMFEYLYEHMRNNQFCINKESFKLSLEIGSYIIFFDGFDEVNTEIVQQIVFEVKDLGSRYSKNYFIISSRPMDAVYSWEDYITLDILPLNKEQAVRLINKLDYDEEKKEAFQIRLEKELFRKHKSFASNPLLLLIMLLTFSKNASVPDNLIDFYDKAFAALYETHDATKDLYKRQIKSSLEHYQYKEVFSYICFHSYFRQEYEFSEAKLIEYITKAKRHTHVKPFGVGDYKEDLIQSVCLMVKDGLDYVFVHRSFQEYFAAYYTCKLEDEKQQRLFQRIYDDYLLCELYLEILFNLQPYKVNKLFFYPIIIMLREMYNEFGFSKELFYELDVRFRALVWKNPHEEKFEVTEKRLKVSAFGSKFLNVVRNVCEFNNPNTKVYAIRENARRIAIEQDLYEKTNDIREEVEFYSDYNKRVFRHTFGCELLELFNEEDFQFYFAPHKRQIEMAITYMEEYEENGESSNEFEMLLQEL